MATTAFTRELTGCVAIAQRYVRVLLQRKFFVSLESSFKVLEYFVPCITPLLDTRKASGLYLAIRRPCIPSKYFMVLKHEANVGVEWDLQLAFRSAVLNA